MIIKIGTTTSSNNSVNKDFNVLHNVNCNLLTGSSVITPIVTLSTIPLLNCNYCEIPTYNRFYYIVNYEIISNSLIKLYLRVDVLMSFRTAILNNHAIINRQANNWNLYLNDGSIKTYQNNTSDQYSCTGSLDGDSLVLAVSGGNDEPIQPPEIPGGGGDGSNINLNSKHYINVSYGGFNPCIVINKQTGSVVPNCVGFAYGRFQELARLNTPVPHLPAVNAGLWFDNAKPYFKTGQTPRVGAVICFAGNANHAGHVGIVEQIKDNKVICSMSDYGGRALYYRTYDYGHYYSPSGLKFQGFIYNPYLNNRTETNEIQTNTNENQTNTNEIQTETNELNQYYAVAYAVIRGEYGNGEERVKKLTARGYDANKVQQLVNELLK